MNVNLVTLFDIGYAARGLAMLESSRVPYARQNVLFLGSSGGDFAKVLEERGVRVFFEDDFLRENQDLLIQWSQKSRSEQIFTLGPVFLRKILESSPTDSWVFYVDSDVFFYSDIQTDLRLEGKDLVLVPHNHSWWNRRRLSKYGYFNVGVVGFKASKVGKRAAAAWSTMVRQWCFDRVEGDKYADQKYLERLALSYEAQTESPPREYHLAPWNSSFLRIMQADDGTMQIRGGKAIVSFHFQGLRKSGSYWILGHLNYFGLASQSLISQVYVPYVRAVEKIESSYLLPSLRANRTGRFRALSELAAICIGQKVKGSQ